MSASCFGTTRGRRSAKSGGRSRAIVRRGYHARERVYSRAMSPASAKDSRRLLPSVDQILRTQELRLLVELHGRAAVTGALREALAELRARAAQPDTQDLQTALAGLGGQVAERLERRARPALRRVINATGVVVHTNLGRAPLAAEAAAHVAE